MIICAAERNISFTWPLIGSSFISLTVIYLAREKISFFMFYRASEVNDTWLFLRPARSIYRFSWIGQDGPDGITLVSLHELVFSFILVFCWTSSWVFMRNEDRIIPVTAINAGQQARNMEKMSPASRRSGYRHHSWKRRTKIRILTLPRKMIETSMKPGALLLSQIWPVIL